MATVRGVAIYLLRYVRDGPISDRRIEQANAETVNFRYASHRTGKTERMTLNAAQFMTRTLRSEARFVQQGVEVDAPTKRGSPGDGG